MRRLFASASLGMLTLLLGVPAALYSQDEPKPPKQEEPRAEPKAEPRPEPRPGEANPPKEREEAKPPKQDDSKRQRDEGQQQPHAQNGHIARPAGKTVRIPDEKFRAQFGRSHTFVISKPVVVEGQPRFQYSGYWFVIAESWPVGWAYTDDCYIDYLDGDYFLFDLLHPDVRVMVFVVS